ncbi:MAG: hypothetical protein JO288_11650 [Hyphomicrobiales bacterium]|nr:hypothetical protein [Hyphomicrobiales bacterium]
MRRELSLAIAFCLVSETAFAAVPVADTQRETQEKKISDCMQKARVYKQDTLKPSQGITKSVKTPGSATGSVPQAGATNVTGQDASGALGYVSGIDYSALVPAEMSGGAAPVTPASLGLNTAAQAVLALSNVSTGIQGNKASQLAAALAMGGLALAQGAWDQNSLARANNGAQWNQVLMTALMTAKLFNQRGVDILGGSSSAANFLTFLPSQATFITPQTISDNNAIVMPIE